MIMADTIGLRVTWGGVRGSNPVCTPGFERFGGATTALMVEASDPLHKLIIDGGSGLDNLTPFPSPAPAGSGLLMIFTHFHLDHLMGLTGFAPLFDDTLAITLAAPEQEHGMTLETAATRLVSPPYWPVTPFASRPFLNWPARPAEPYTFGPFVITWMPVAHPNGCSAYRIVDRESGQALIFATDFEWAAMSSSERDAFFAFCGERPEILILDGQFDDAEADRYRGWGHSTWQEDLAIARRVNAQQLFITHHAPQSDDALLEARQQTLSDLFPNARFARQS